MNELTPPANYDPTRDLTSPARVMLWALVRSPTGTVVRVEDIGYLLGRPVSRHCVHSAVRRLRREPFGLPIAGQVGGGYRMVAG